ncbi:MAG: glycosyltransferase family 2 protein [Chitinophagaceae bacterium]|nr:glycosyltransferase family 2 protein [Chitinophagaceae bacterium]MCW5904904.1 glycosyltransferase family 2 protein [Chitinophagaceae bacterium]
MILTIICPTFNEEKYIEKTINSFLQQKIHSFELEILICDGMSTDNTRAIVQSMSAKNSIIRLVDNPNKRTPFAFNIGLKEAKGDYVAILGAHCEYENNYLQTCFDKLSEKKVIACSGRVITKVIHNTLQAKLCEWVSNSRFGVSGNSFRVIKEGYVHTVAYGIFNKQALLDLGGYNEKLIRNQDNDMNQRLLDAGYKLYSTWNTHCYYYPPYTIKQLFKYAKTNGSWNVISFFINKKSMRLHHFIPFLFVSAILLLLLIGIVEYFVNHSTLLLIILAAIISLHLLIGIIASLLIREGNPFIRIILLPFVFLGFHLSYGWGTLKTFITRRFT